MITDNELPTNDSALFKFCREHLFSAVIGDVMDVMGLRNQFLPPEIRPLTPEMVLVGRAMTVQEEDHAAEPGSDPTAAFGLMFDALDDLKQDEVYICTGSSPAYALWGELMTVRARILGAAGAVLDGFSRDTSGVLAHPMPVFSFGSYAQDQGVRGRVIAFRVPIVFQNGVQVEDGDLIFGDRDGVVVVPRARERDVLERAREKVFGENTVRKAIEAGMSTREAFRVYGIM